MCLMPNWGSLSNTFLVGHEYGILMTCPSLRHRHDARYTVQLSKLVVHPSPPRSMLEHIAKDSPEDALLKHGASLGWSRIRVRRGPPGESIYDIPHISCGIEVFWISAVGEAHSMHDSPAQYDFAADVVVRSNYRPEIAKLLYHLETFVVN